MARVIHARLDDVKYTTIRERKHMFNVYIDFHKPISNPDLCTNPVGMPVLGMVMLDLSLITIFACSLLHNKIEH